MDTRIEMPINELLNWVYQKQRADLIYELGAGLYEVEKVADGINTFSRSSDGCFVIARDGELGCRIDACGMLPSGQLHPDAEKIHDVIMSLPKQHIYILINYAKMGSSPDILKGVVSKFKPLIHEKGRHKGKPVMECNDNKEAIATKVTIDYPPHYVDSCREFYKIWYDLHVKLANRRWDLKNYIPVMPSVSRTPWEKTKNACKIGLEIPQVS